MFSFRTNLFTKNVFSNIRSKMSSSTQTIPGKPLPLPKETPYQKVRKFISKNRQQLINIIGVYFVFSYAVHNYRIKLAWDELELEFKELQLEVDRIKDALQDEEWTTNIETEIRNTKASTNSGILLDQIKRKINPITESLAESVAKRSASNEEGDMSVVLGSLVGNVGDSKGSGRIM